MKNRKQLLQVFTSAAATHTVGHDDEDELTWEIDEKS
jgi:hypothetical protein